MAHPSLAAISATSILPIRPPHPTTPILIRAMLRLRVSGEGTVTDRLAKYKRRPFLRSTPGSGIVLPTCSLYTAGMTLLRSVATVGSYTAISRVFGFIRDILTAAILGAGPVADAFFVAQRLPNLFRSLFAEGAFSAAFVPLFAGTMAEQGKEAARIFAEDALAVLLAALLVFLLLAEIFMPAVMAVIAPGFSEDPTKFELAIELARITFPYQIGRASCRERV